MGGKGRRLNVLPQHEEAAKGRFPPWLHRKLPKGQALWQTGKVLQQQRMSTVCEEAKCPNLLECWTAKTATFLAMGKQCTRNCGFCAVDFQKTPPALEEDEPLRIAQSVKELGLKHVVITMVARDDLIDGGAAHLAKIIRTVRKECAHVTLEVLTSDFGGSFDAVDQVLEAQPEIFNYNTETVRALTPRVRHKATYAKTLALLRYAKIKGKGLVKSGLMVGLGETPNQVEETLRDLAYLGCDIITIGQYLQPNRKKLLVKEFVTPEQFDAYAHYGRLLGVKQMYCGPFVRSSYNAAQFIGG